VEASTFDKGTCYVTFDNHRHDDMKPYVMVTRDFGRTFANITSDLPDGSVYVIREDHKNPRLLFVGTEFGAFASLDQGQRWTRLANNLPTVAVHDLVIHPRDADLVAGTHGRSIWILDDITALQQMSPAIEASELHLFESRVATRWRQIRLGRKQPNFLFRGENPPRGGLLHFYAGSANAEVDLTIESADSEFVWKKRLSSKAGLNRVRWQLDFAPTQGARDAMRARLARTIADLEGRDLSEQDQDALRRTKASLARARGDRSLNRVRSTMVQRFAAHTNRRDFFGPSIQRVPAPPGTYRVTIQSGSEQRVGEITVREDPLKTR